MNSKRTIGLTIGLLVAACGQPSSNSGVASSKGGSATSAPESPNLLDASVDAAQPQDPLLPYPGKWDPKSMALEGTASIVMYVTAKVAYLCPTRRQAQDRTCLPEYRKGRGNTVSVIPNSLFDGHYRAIIDSNHAWYPRWVRADDIGEAPTLFFHERFASRPDVQAARSATPQLSKRQIAKLPVNTSIAWQARSDIKFGMFHGQADDTENASNIVYFVPVADGIVGVRFREWSAGSTSQRHWCFMYEGACIELDLYKCEPNDSCAAVSILATTTGNLIELPKKFKSWSNHHSKPWPWPKKWRGKVPLLEGVVMADRQNLMEYPLLHAWQGEPEGSIYDLYNKLSLLAAKEPRLRDMASKKIATNLGLFFETGTRTEPDPDYAKKKAAFDAALQAKPRSPSWVARNRPQEQRVVFADDGIILSIVVRDKRVAPIQEAVPPERIMGPYHFLEVRVEGPKTAEFKELRSQILAIVDGEIRAFGSSQ